MLEFGTLAKGTLPNESVLLTSTSSSRAGMLTLVISAGQTGVDQAAAESPFRASRRGRCGTPLRRLGALLEASDVRHHDTFVQERDELPRDVHPSD